MTKLFIGGFPLEMTEMEVVQIIAPFAEVVTIKLVRDRATKKCKGYGFVEVSNEEDAKMAIAALDGSVSGDRVLSLNMVTSKETEAPSGRNQVPTDAQRLARSKRPRRPRLDI